MLREETPPAPDAADGQGQPLRSKDDVVREHVLRVYHQLDGNLTAAAKTLNLSRNTLYKLLRSYGILRGSPEVEADPAADTGDQDSAGRARI